MAGMLDKEGGVGLGRQDRVGDGGRWLRKRWVKRHGGRNRIGEESRSWEEEEEVEEEEKKRRKSRLLLTKRVTTRTILLFFLFLRLKIIFAKVQPVSDQQKGIFKDFPTKARGDEEDHDDDIGDDDDDHSDDDDDDDDNYVDDGDD